MSERKKEIAKLIVDITKFIEDSKVHPDGFIIDDYPIGRRARGKCKLEVEYKPSHGFRTKRKTTNRNDLWCAPKTGVYMKSPIYVVTHNDEHEEKTGWMRVGPNGLTFWGANFTVVKEILCPFNTAPQRKETSYSVNGVKRTVPADPPEYVDAWESWAIWLQGCTERLMNVDSYAESTA